MTTPQYSILTVAGKNAEAAAMANATPITIAEVALGDGNRFPTGAEIALENEVHRGALTASGVVDGNANIAYFDLYIPVGIGGFVIREAGLFDDLGTMIAVARFDPAIPKFDPASGATNDLTIRIHVVFSDLANVVFSIEPLQAVTVNNLVQVLPWATNAQALDPLQENRIIDPKRLHLVLAAAMQWANDVEVLDPALEDLIVDPKRLHLAVLDLAFPTADKPPKSPNLTRFHYYADGTQSYPHGVPINVNCGVLVEDNLINSTYDGVTRTIGDQDAGLWGFLATSDFVGGAGSFGIDHRVYLSGQAEALAKDNRSAHTASNLATNLVCFERLNAGDQIFHQLIRNDAGGGNGFPQQKSTRFVGMRFSV